MSSLQLKHPSWVGRDRASLTRRSEGSRLSPAPPQGRRQFVLQENGTVTKKEIVKQISDRIGLTQLKTKEIVQQTFDAIVDTLIQERRIELRNFGVFEVKERKARKARNPRTGEKVDVPPKFVVTFKPGKEMEERVRQLDVGGESQIQPQSGQARQTEASGADGRRTEGGDDREEAFAGQAGQRNRGP
jgi:integration host factor subunit beta